MNQVAGHILIWLEAGVSLLLPQLAASIIHLIVSVFEATVVADLSLCVPRSGCGARVLTPATIIANATGGCASIVSV